MRINAFYIDYYSVEKQICSTYNAFMLFDIGTQIRLTRKVRKLTQADLASALGMSRTTIGQIENGTVQDIGIRKVIRLLEFLELELRVRPLGKPPTLEELQEEEER
jgi:transcriptional regulator with XRE-family HTH domain